MAAMTDAMKDSLKACKRVVVKIGSALLVDQDTGRVRRKWLESLAQDILELRGRGCEVAVVSSGAIAVGRRILGLPHGPLKLEEKQAAAAVGQIHLAHAYQEVLAPHGVTVAQVLVTLEDTEDRRRYLNARNTLDTLLRLTAVPVINENDTVATAEIRYGDNDRLGARVAAMIGADTLILLSDIDGLYTADPTRHADAEFIPEVREITPEMEAGAGMSGSYVGSGGMVTKLVAGRICMNAGCRMAIALGKRDNPIKAIEDGARVTWFLPSLKPATARKKWIMGSLAPAGTVVVDDGAVKALRAGKSLLPAGVCRVDGDFERGDAVLITDTEGRTLGRGLTAYSSTDAIAI
ncbi:MAG: glutamate 5-kinase, partial [Alphaproteobacteria bacterium RIFOXYD12_FULL_60_8]